MVNGSRANTAPDADASQFLARAFDVTILLDPTLAGDVSVSPFRRLFALLAWQVLPFCGVAIC